MSTEAAPTPTPAMTFSSTWSWVERVNYLVGAILIGHFLRAPREAHLVSRDAFSVLAFVAALLSAYGTRRACADDLANHVPAGRSVRPDHHGTVAWVWYMSGVLCLYAVFFTLPLVFTFVLVPIVLVAQTVFFGVAWLRSLYGLGSDERKLRSAIGVIFPVVALLMSSLALSPIIPGPGKANTRACYANQKTIVGAIEMYNLDHERDRRKIAQLDEVTFGLLRSGGYLQSIPQDPGAGPGSSAAYQLTQTGNGIQCTKHGAIQ